MIRLIVYPAALGLYSPSPFCVKAAYLLTLSGLDWEREDLSDPRKMPNGKLPAIRVDGRIIADSDAIRAWIEEQGTDLEPGLDRQQKAMTRIFTRMIEEHLYFHLMYDRWANETVWPLVRAAYFGHLPPLVRNVLPGMLRRDVLKTLYGNGVSRFTDEERLARADQDLTAIATFLGEKTYLMGDTLTAVDCSAAAMLGGMRTSPIPTPLSKRVAEDAALSAYIDRVETALPLG